MAATTVDAAPQGPERARITELDQMRTDAAQARRPQEGQWYLNYAMYLGHQWVKWAKNGLVEVQLDDGHPRTTENRIKLVTKQAIAKETKNRPTAFAQPHSLDEDDQMGALVSEEVFDWAWDELQVTRMQRIARFWRRLAGIGFLKTTWDRELGDPFEVYVDENDEPLVINDQPMIPGSPVAEEMLAKLQVQPKKKTLHTGDVRVEPRNPWQIYVDPLATEEGLSSAEWLIEEAIRSSSYVKAHYPKHADKVVADAHAGMGIVGPRLPGLSPRSGSGPMTGVRVWELWRKPCADYPKGQHVVWIAGAVLHDGDNPYGWLPYDEMRGDPSGIYWPEAPTTDLIPLQVRLNKRLSQIDENADRTANAPLMYPDDLKPVLEAWTHASGEHIAYPPMGTSDSVPRYLQSPEMPVYTREDADKAKEGIRELAGQNEVSQGMVPAGVTAAAAITALQEANDTQFGPDIEEGDIALQGLARKILELYGTFANDERIIRIAGEDGAWDIETWRGSTMRGHYDIKVEIGSSAPRSKAMKQAAMSQVMDLFFKYGGPESLNPRNIRKFLREYEVGGLERLFEDMTGAESKVNREHRRLALGGPVSVKPWENHQLEIEAHNEFRMSARYERLAAENPQFALALDAHVQEHMALIAPTPPMTPDGKPLVGPPPPQATAGPAPA